MNNKRSGLTTFLLQITSDEGFVYFENKNENFNNKKWTKAITKIVLTPKALTEKLSL
jgi:hypothetical protein